MTVDIEPGDYGIYCLAYNSDTEPTDEEFELSDEEFCKLARIETYKLVFGKVKCLKPELFRAVNFDINVRNKYQWFVWGYLSIAVVTVCHIWFFRSF